MPVSSHVRAARRAFRPARALLAAALGFAALPVAAQTYSQTVFFGDSLTDAGFYRPFLVETQGPQANAVGRFTTNPALVWAEFLADYYDTDGNSAWGLTTTGIVGAGGDNYAAGGATISPGPGFPPQPPTQFAPSLTDQVNAYLGANGGRADADALFTVWGGANDLFFHLNGATTQAQFLAAAGAQVGLVGTLSNAGARYILVPNMPDVGRTPFGLSQGPAGSAGISALVEGYNATLFAGLQQAGLRVIPLDTFNFIREISASPSRYGFTTATTPACVGVPSSLVCNPNSLVAPNAGETHAFADGVHPGAAAHRLLADFALSVLEAPRQIQVLTYSEAAIGRARAERVFAQLDGARLDEDRGDGMRWWMDVRGDNQRYHEPNHYDGGGPSLSLGVDWGSDAFRYGGFAGYGVQKIDFGLRRGDFEQTDASIGGYAGWQSDALWINGQVSYSRLGFEVDRAVRLGPATRVHSGSPDGNNLSAGLAAGWDFRHGGLTHGPVLSVLSQRIEVDGYAENSSESTALAYPGQEFDSLLGSLGWRASIAISDHVRPYARATIDREFEDFAEDAFARSQSIPGTMDYAVPGLERDEQYGTLQFGVRTQLFGLDANIGASATFNQDGGDDSSVFASFGGRF
jgi:outer membrane lipase/esterase